MAIVFFNDRAFKQAKEELGDVDKEQLIARAKELTSGYLEGTNAEVESQPGYIRFMDEEKPKKKAKKAKAVKKAKKGKK